MSRYLLKAKRILWGFSAGCLLGGAVFLICASLTGSVLQAVQSICLALLASAGATLAGGAQS